MHPKLTEIMTWWQDKIPKLSIIRVLLVLYPHWVGFNNVSCSRRKLAMEFLHCMLKILILTLHASTGKYNVINIQVRWIVWVKFHCRADYSLYDILSYMVVFVLFCFLSGEPLQALIRLTLSKMFVIYGKMLLFHLMKCISIFTILYFLI